MFGFTFEDLKEASAVSLQTATALERMELMVDDLEYSREWGDALNIVSRFRVAWKPLLDERGPTAELAKGYRVVWARCVFLAFPGTTREELETLYTRHILPVFERYSDPREIIDDQLYRVRYDEKLGPMLKLILDSLQINTEILGRKDIVRANKKTVPPQVSWWLTQYRASVNPGLQRGAIEQIGFLNKDPNMKNVTGPERSLLTKIIQFHDYLLYPNSYPTKKQTFYDNWLEEQFRKQSEGLIDEQLQKRPPTDVAAPTPVVSAPVSRPASVPATVPTAVAPVVVASPKDDPIAKIREMVSAGNFAPLLAGRPPTSQNLAAVLREAYTRRAGLDDSQAAREAVHIANLLKKQGRPEFMNMAYYDVSSQSFKWNE